MRICFVTSHMATIGGQERVLANLANSLVEYTGVEVAILFTSPEKLAHTYAYPLNEKIEIIWSKELSQGKYSYFFWKIFRLLNKRIYRFKSVDILKKIYFPKSEINKYEHFFEKNYFDVLVGLSPRQAGLIGLLGCKAKKIGWLHSSYKRYFQQKYDFQWNQQLLYKKLLPKLDEIIVLTDYDVRKYQRELGIASRRIYNPLSFCSEEKADFVGNRLLFVGRLNYKIKGLGLLNDILKLVVEKIPGAILTVVGDGADKKRFIDDAKNKGVWSYIRMAGPSDDIQVYYRAADVLLMTSRVEGFGLVVTEAMECGVPVVSFNTTGPSEIISDKEDGYIVENFDVIEFTERVVDLCTDLNLHKKMASAAVKKARQFSRKDIAGEWEKLFFELTDDIQSGQGAEHEK